MPKVKISEYSATANSNTDVASINIDEGCAPSGINNAIRAIMGHLKDFQSGTNGDPFNGPVNGTLGATTASTAVVTTLTTSSTVTHNGGTANGVAYLNGSKVLTTGSALVFDGTNLGVGVTPSAWSSSYRAVQIANSSSIMGGTSGNDTYYLTNAYFDTDWKYAVSSKQASKYEQVLGAHAWYNAPTGTAGNAITFTQAMTLDVSGNLALGNTSSLSAASGRVDLTINGTSSAMTSFGTGGTRRGYVLHDATDLTIASETAGNIRFLNNGSERARIDSSGNLLVGVTSTTQSHKFANKTASAWTTQFVSEFSTAGQNYGITCHYTQASPNNTTNQFFEGQDNSGTRVVLRSNGGIANYSANNVNLSDRREKTNFAPASSYLDKICAIPVQTFNYIDQNMEDDGGLTLGVVAQDVQAVAPEMVMESNWGTKEEPKMRLSIYQTDLQYALMKCIQEQQALITQLTARITALEGA